MSLRNSFEGKPRLRGTAWRVALAAFFLVLGFYSIADYVAFEYDAVHVSGTVKALERHQHATGRRGGKVATVRPKVEFTPQGAETPVLYSTSVDHRDEFEVGDVVEVEYTPHKVESTVRIATGLPTLDVVVTVLGFLLLAHAGMRVIQHRNAVRRVSKAPLASGSSGQLGQAPLKG